MWLRRLLWGLLIVLLVPVVVLAAAYGWLQTGSGKRWLADQIESAAAGPGMQLAIGELDGSVPFAPVVRDVVMSDDAGAWLTVDRAEVRLDPWALFGGVAKVELIEVGRVELSRPPPPSPTPVEPEPDEPFSWPQLPVDLEVDRLHVDEVVLGAPVLGQPAGFTISGVARLGDVGDGLIVDLAIDRTDAFPGSLTAKLRFVPETQQLTAELHLDEPEGGMLARLAALPSLPALTVDLQGDGTLDAWHADLVVDGGTDLALEATADIAAEPAGRRITLDLAGRVAAFVEGPARPLADADMSVAASVLVGADGPVTVDRLAIAGAFGEVALTGTADLAAETVDLALSVVPAEAERFAYLIGEAAWRDLRLSATATGPMMQPEIALTVAGTGIAYGDMALASLDAVVNAAPNAPVTAANLAVDLRADIAIDGLDLGADAARGLVEEPTRIVFAGTLSPAGDVAVDSLTVDSPLAQLSAEGGAEAWGTGAARVAGSLTVGQLARFQALAGLPLAGAAAIRIDGDWDGDRATVTASAAFDDLVTGIAQADALLGPGPRLALDASLDADGAVQVDSLALTGTGLDLNASGGLGGGSLGIDWQLALADLSAVEPSLAGAVTAEGRITGSPDDPSVSAAVTLTGAQVAGYALGDTDIEADINDLVSAPSGGLSLQGAIAGLPAALAAEIAMDADGAIRLDGIDLTLASLSVGGAVALDPAGLASGQLSVRAGNLGDLRPFTGEALSGMVDATVTLAAADGQQSVDVTAAASGAGLPGTATVSRADLTVRVADALGAPAIDARVQASGILAAGQALDRAVITAQGGLDALAFTADLADDAMALATRGSLALGAGTTRIDLAALTGRYMDVDAALAGPASITLAADGAIAVDNLVITAEGGRLAIDGRYGATSDLVVTMTDLPVELARLFAPDAGLGGRVNGTVRLSGSRAAPQATADITASGITATAVREAGFTGFDAATSMTWQGGRLAVETTVTGSFDGSVTASLAVQAPADPATGLPVIDEGAGVTGTLTGNTSLDMLNDLLAGGGDRVTGALAVNLTVAGTVGEPLVAGTVEVTDGSYRNVLNGVQLDNIVVRLAGDGQRLTITEFAARTPNGGTLGATGSIGVDPDEGLPVDVAIGFDDALVINSDLVSAEIRGEIGIGGELASALAVDGHIDVVEAEVRLNSRLPPSIPTLDVVEVNVPPELAASRPPPPEPRAAGQSALQVALNLTIAASERLYVRGRGLEAEMQGDIAISGSADHPNVAGGFQMRRGHMDMLGRRFEFDQGTVTLPEDGTLDPEIDFVARTDLNDAVAQVTVTGRASAPQIAFDSVPELPQDEILARILFEKPTSSLTAFEAIQLARSAAELTGIAPGSDILGDVRDSLGLDVIDVRQDDENVESSTLSVGRYVDDNVYLGVEQGLEAGSSRVTVEIELTPNISIETDVGADSGGRLGIKMEWDY
ncbi:MAG: translocation/assembly module TamB domain-containing protein [Rhodospirillaceae bacterium]|nr:translocation/assembly module TamB domain-containing protein [Rhodospirillaceae bacterium]